MPSGAIISCEEAGEWHHSGLQPKGMEAQFMPLIRVHFNPLRWTKRLLSHNLLNKFRPFSPSALGCKYQNELRCFAQAKVCSLLRAGKCSAVVFYIFTSASPISFASSFERAYDILTLYICNCDTFLKENTSISWYHEYQLGRTQFPLEWPKAETTGLDYDIASVITGCVGQLLEQQHAGAWPPGALYSERAWMSAST